MSLADLSDRLDRAGLPFSPINRPGDLFEDPHLSASDGLVPVHLTEGIHAGAATQLPRLPIEFGQTKSPLHHDIPAGGRAQPGEVLQELGLNIDQIAALIERGILNT
jgi:crotonobetainyl-CoA:carnitine CoA-transferase CaiB-like acyl-CoA transferase